MPTVGVARNLVDEEDLEKVRVRGILRQAEAVEFNDPWKPEFGVKSKAFAPACGFQLFMKFNTTKTSGSGNSKYCCKLLHGQQLFIADSDTLPCPFLINACGSTGVWKILKIQFAHNHRHVGFTSAPQVDGELPRPARQLRKQTHMEASMVAIVENEMLPAHGDSLTIKSVKSFMQGQTAFRCRYPQRSGETSAPSLGASSRHLTTYLRRAPVRDSSSPAPSCWAKRLLAQESGAEAACCRDGATREEDAILRAVIFGAVEAERPSDDLPATNISL
ncbi:hypothetical protein PybrP1_007320 [[Pythium] brassicae (nom. inval.)]|nr:hypothetical protein PybrP1_007320 [[Pythium] brassicae (nom. inval.)]